MSEQTAFSAFLVFTFLVIGCTAAPLTDSDGQGRDSVWTSPVLAVSSLVCLVLAAAGCACCCGKNSLLKFEETVEYDERHNGTQGHSDAFADFSPPTQSTPSHPPGSVSETVNIEPLPDLASKLQAAGHGVPQVKAGPGSSEEGDLKHLKSPRFVFPRDQLNYVDELGNGWFGKVLQGEAHRLHPGMRKTRVVIKQLRDTATPEEQILFLKEVQPFREVNHPNVLMLLGQCIETIPLLLVLEYAPYGDLKNYLHKNRGSVDDMAAKDVQLRMAHDIISALLWLHQTDFIHIDFAARNCQVCADTSVKIGDYGLALEKYPEDYYLTKDGSHAVPIRWLAPEVMEVTGQDIRPKKITKQSNIWSFGVIMLELSTCGDRPYSNLSDEEVLKQVVVDLAIKLDKPSLNVKYADKWFEIMLFCWMESESRPTVKEIHELLTHLKKNTENVNMEDFDTRWNALKPASAANQSSSDSSVASQDASLKEPAPSVGQNSLGAALSSPVPGDKDIPLTPPPDTTQQEVSVDVQLPSFGEDKVQPGGQMSDLFDDFAEADDAEVDDFANIRAPALDDTNDDEFSDARQPVADDGDDDVIQSVAVSDVQASLPPPAIDNSRPGMFDDTLNAPSPIPGSQPDQDRDKLEDSLFVSDTSAKTPDFFSSSEADGNPFASSHTPNIQSPTDTSMSSAAYNTALSSAIETDDSAATFTESFNSNPFSSSSEMGGFVSAVESTGEFTAPDHDNHGFGDFEGSSVSFGTPEEDLSSIHEISETPTPGTVIRPTSNFLGDFSPVSGDSTASISFSADVDTPVSKGKSTGQNGSSAEQDGSDVKDSSLLSFGAITLKDQDVTPSASPLSSSHPEFHQGFTAVNTAHKKPFGMTMLTVKSGSKKKSIEIPVKDEEEEAAAEGSQTSNGHHSATMETAASGLVAMGTKDADGEGGLGSIEVNVSGGEVNAQSADLDAFGAFEDFSR